MNELTAKEYRERQLSLLQRFHDFCKEHNLRYSLAYGTLLGAVRHNGFIPWDDDMDVMMPRPDYDKFTEMARMRPVPFAFYDFRSSRAIMYPFAKCTDPHTSYWRSDNSDAHAKVSTGIFLDIFPIDALPRVKWLARLIMKFMYIWRLSISLKQTPESYYKKYLRTKFSLVKRIAFRTLQVAGFLCPKYPCWICMEAFFRIFDYQKAIYFTDFTGGPSFRHLALKEWLDGIIMHRFEDREFCIISGYDQWLTMYYGDWRTPPPQVEKDGHVHLVGGVTQYDESTYMTFHP